MTTVSFNAGLIISVKKNVNANFQNIINIVEDNLVAVTNASSISNPTLPTLILGGNVIYSNPSTLPTVGATANIQCYASFTCQNIVTQLSVPTHDINITTPTSIPIDDCISWNVQINNNGGTWQTNTFHDYGQYGDNPIVFGLNAALTRKGFAWSSSSAGWLNSGILGPRDLNRELAFLVFGNAQYQPQAPNQFLQNPAALDLKTHADAARLIASLAKASVQWIIPDYQFFTWQPQASTTALQAMNSLASECGGILRWNGGNKYLACFPNHSTGDFTVPDCCLIIAAQEECNQDLNSGLYNPGVYMVPQLGTFDAGTYSIISAFGTSGGTNGQGLAAISNTAGPSTQASQLLTPGSKNIQPITPIYQSKTIMTSSSPAEIIPLDLDTDNIYIQNVTVSDGTGPYVTNDPNSWSLLQSGLGGGSVQWKDVGGKVQPQLELSPSLFPSSNSDATNGNWYLRVGVTKVKAPVAQVDTATNSLGRTLMKYKWIPICTGSITCIFFGAIPMPGMTLHAEFNGQTLTGIIESVSFVNPGILTINYVKWAELKYYTQLGNTDNVNAILHQG